MSEENNGKQEQNNNKPDENAGQQGPESGKQPPWGKPENFNAEQAWELIQNLRKEKGADTSALEKQISDLKKAGDDQRDALAKALGVKPEETSDTDKLTQQLTELSKQFAASQHRATLLEVAASPGVDAEGKPLPAIPKEYHHLLTATETEALQAQAKAVAELMTAGQAASGIPGFAAPAGQGQGNDKSPSLQDQLAGAEKELAGKTRGTPEYRAAQQKLMDLKSQQLFAAQQTTK
jgi:hypothetical protein